MVVIAIFLPGAFAQFLRGLRLTIIVPSGFENEVELNRVIP